MIKSLYFQDLHNPPELEFFSIISTSNPLSSNRQAVINPVGPDPKIIIFFPLFTNYLFFY